MCHPGQILNSPVIVGPGARVGMQALQHLIGAFGQCLRTRVPHQPHSDLTEDALTFCAVHSFVNSPLNVTRGFHFIAECRASRPSTCNALEDLKSNVPGTGRPITSFLTAVIVCFCKTKKPEPLNRCHEIITVQRPIWKIKTHSP